MTKGNCSSKLWLFGVMTTISALSASIGFCCASKSEHSRLHWAASVLPKRRYSSMVGERPYREYEANPASIVRSAARVTCANSSFVLGVSVATKRSRSIYVDIVD